MIQKSKWERRRRWNEEKGLSRDERRAEMTFSPHLAIICTQRRSIAWRPSSIAFPQRARALCAYEMRSHQSLVSARDKYFNDGRIVVYQHHQAECSRFVAEKYRIPQYCPEIWIHRQHKGKKWDIFALFKRSPTKFILQ